MPFNGTEEQKAKLVQALREARKAFAPVVRDTENPHFKKSYASLAAVKGAVDEPLEAAGLIVLQEGEVGTMTLGQAAVPAVIITGIMRHAEGGEWVQRMEIPLAGNGPQAVGSSITYGMRYQLKLFCGLAEEDDDGESGEGRGRGAQRATPAQRPQPQPQPAGDGLTEEQQQRVEATLIDNGLTVAWLLKRLGKDRIADIPARWYEQTMAAIKEKAAKGGR